MEKRIQIKDRIVGLTRVKRELIFRCFWDRWDCITLLPTLMIASTDVIFRFVFLKFQFIIILHTFLD